MLKKARHIKARHIVEGGAFWTICRLFQALSFKKASAFGGWLVRTCGPHFPVHQVAEKNLQTVFPKMSKEKRASIVKDMWEHWGRVAAEYCHIPYVLKTEELIIIEGKDIVQQLREDGKGAILFSAHLGNFQMITIAADRCGLPLVQFYRQANNPFVDKGMRHYQQQAAKRILAKGEQGTLGMLRALKAQEHLFVLIDQKVYEGVPIPFLGHPAYTSTAVAKMAKHFGCPLVPVQCERLQGHFKVTFYPPLDTTRDEEDIMKKANALIAGWVTEHPEQWFWVHKRWPFSG